MKKYLIIFSLILILISSIIILVNELNTRTKERNRWQNNYFIASEKATYYTDKTGSQAATINELQLTINEVKNSADSVIISLVNENKNLGNKLKNTETILKISTTKIDTITVTIHDTIIKRVGDTITRIATYCDNFLTLTTAVFPNKLEHNYKFTDNIIGSLGWHKKRKKFFVWRWLNLGKKIYDFDVKSTNPNENITYLKTIRITGKKGR